MSNLVYANDVNLSGENINTVKKSMEALLDVGKELGLEINTKKKARCIFMSCHQTVGQNRNINVANKSFDNAAKFKFLGTAVINKNCFH
jgi:hypothetical protein